MRTSTLGAVAASRSVAKIRPPITGGGGGPGPGPGGGNEPNVPADTTDGTPAHKMLHWGSGLWLFNARSQYDTYDGWGYGGYKTGTYHLPGFGGGDDWKPSLAADSSAPYTHQWGAQTGNGGGEAAALAAALGWETYIGHYFKSTTQSTLVPPFGDWFNATTRTTVIGIIERWAEAAEFLGMDGLAWDLELGNGEGWAADGYEGDTHTEAENRAEAHAWGVDIGEAIWTAKPDANLIVYGSSHVALPGDFNDKVQEVVNELPYPNTTQLVHNLLYGVLEGMENVGGTGLLIIACPIFYRAPFNNITGATFPAAYKLNSQAARAFMSSQLSGARRSFALHHLAIVGFTWLHSDGTDFYDNNEPTPAQWANYQDAAWRYSEFERRVEYNHPGGWPGHTLNPKYDDPVAIEGTQEHSSQTPLNTDPPVFTNVVATVSGGAVTITCDVAHDYGVAWVDVFVGSTYEADPGGSFLGTMHFNQWDEAGGSVTTNFDDAFMDCTFSAGDGAVGDWYVLEAGSIKGDVAHATVQAQAS